MGHMQTVQNPDQMAQYAASDQGLHCLHTECSIKIQIKMKNTFHQPSKGRLDWSN